LLAGVRKELAGVWKSGRIIAKARDGRGHEAIRKTPVYQREKF